MVSIETYGGGHGEPTIHVEENVHLLVPDFAPHPEAHTRLLADCGMNGEQRERLHVEYRSFSEYALAAIRTGTEEGISHALCALLTKGDFEFNSLIRVYIGHQSAYTSAAPEALKQVNMDRVNTTALHEMGHFVDSELHGKQKPDLRVRAGANMRRGGVGLRAVAASLVSDMALEYLHPLYLANAPASAVVIGGMSVAGMAITKGAESAHKAAYRSSPQEEWARQFALQHSERRLVSGTPTDFDIGRVLVQCAKAA